VDTKWLASKTYVYTTLVRVEEKADSGTLMYIAVVITIAHTSRGAPSSLLYFHWISLVLSLYVLQSENCLSMDKIMTALD